MEAALLTQISCFFVIDGCCAMSSLSAWQNAYGIGSESAVLHTVLKEVEGQHGESFRLLW